MYEALARAALAPEDPERVIETARRMRERHPDLSRQEVARKLASRSAFSCAAVGVFASAPAAFVAGLPVALDLSYQARSLHRIILSVARVSGRPASPLELAAAGASVLLAGATQAVRRQAIEAARRLPGKRGSILPLAAAALAGAAASYAAARLAGLLAERRFFQKRRR